MAIVWTKKFDATDDGAVLTGTQLGTLQDDIDVGVAGSLPTPGVSDGLKLVRVKSDHSDYELITQVSAAAGGTGADLSVGTAGYAVISEGSAGTMTYSPVYSSQTVTFLADSGAQTVFCASPVTGVVSAVYAITHDSARGAVYTVKVGSAGAQIATGTVASTGVAGQVTSLTLGTVAVAIGGSIGVARGATASTGASTVTIVIIKTP
jgi:hypothetical protein